jgi:hypothetical protein
MRAFVDGHIGVRDFVHAYQTEWKFARDCPAHNRPVEPVFDRAFTAADCYAPPDKPYKIAFDIDETQLRNEITEMLRGIESFDGIPSFRKE